jgi:hypothetical protein
MNEFIGRSINLGVAVEGTRGSAEAVAARTVKKVTCNIIPRSERKIDDSSFGRLEDAERVRTVRKWSEGDVEGVIHVDTLGYYLTNIYGAPETTPVNDVFSHEFLLEQSITHPTLTVFVKDAEVRQEKIAGVVVQSLELTANTDDYLRYKASFLGKAGVADTSEFPALESEFDFVPRDVVVKIATTEAGLAAATAIKAKNLSVNWNANGEADFVVGSYSPDNIYNKQLAIEGSMTLNYTDDDFKDLYEGDDFVYMQVEITGEADLDLASNKPKITILLYKVQVTDWNRGSAADDLVTQEVSFKAFLNTTDEEASKVTLVNLTEEYQIGS